MNNRVVVLIAMLAVMFVATPSAFADDQLPDQTSLAGLGATPPEPDNSVSLTPPPATPQGAKGEKGERGEVGPQGPAGRSGTVTYLMYNAWLAKSENQHYNRWSHSGSHQEQLKRRKTLYGSWKKQIEGSLSKVKARLDSVETVASRAASSATYAHERVTQALTLGSTNAVKINNLNIEVEGLKTGTVQKTPLQVNPAQVARTGMVPSGELSPGVIIVMVALIFGVALVAASFDR